LVTVDIDARVCIDVVDHVVVVAKRTVDGKVVVAPILHVCFYFSYKMCFYFEYIFVIKIFLYMRSWNHF
jgi:hypothetical protein